MFKSRQSTDSSAQNGMRKVSPIFRPHRLTHHAETRLQQRGIPQQVFDMLMEWGHCCRLADGAGKLVIFRKQDLARLKRLLPKPQWLDVERRSRLYAVLSEDGAVVTAGHRYRHLLRQ